MSDTVISMSVFVAVVTGRGGKTFVQRPRGSAVHWWYIDYTHLVKVLIYRRYKVFEQLNRKVEASEVLYICPTPNCPNHKQPQSLIDLLTFPTNSGKSFVCDKCEATGIIYSRST